MLSPTRKSQHADRDFLKKALLIILGALLILGALAYLLREDIGIALIASRIAPEHPFDPALLPDAPDYANDLSWAALPGRTDPADHTPPHTGHDERSRAAVFFLHPTSYFGKDNWNQPLADTGANWITDHRILRYQASVYDGCCEVYAPRYRQATFYSFMDDNGNGEQALDVAYGDTARAFDDFLSRKGDRPFILASHSQGSLHAARLLREKIAGTALQQQLIAAYLIGFAIEDDQVGGLPVCDSATDTGCVLGWNAVEDKGAGLYPDAPRLICVNPLTWTTDDAHGKAEMNLGGIGFDSYIGADEEEEHNESNGAMAMTKAVADAQCVNRNLVVSDLRSEDFPSRLPGGSMHVYDYGLYYMNIRKNARQRVNAYFDKAQPQVTLGR